MKQELKWEGCAQRFCSHSVPMDAALRGDSNLGRWDFAIFSPEKIFSLTASCRTPESHQIAANLFVSRHHTIPGSAIVFENTAALNCPSVDEKVRLQIEELELHAEDGCCCPVSLSSRLSFSHRMRQPHPASPAQQPFHRHTSAPGFRFPAAC